MFQRRDYVGQALGNALNTIGGAFGQKILSDADRAEQQGLLAQLQNQRDPRSPMPASQMSGNLEQDAFQQRPMFDERNIGLLSQLHPQMLQLLTAIHSMNQPTYFNLGQGENRFAQSPMGGPPRLVAQGPPKDIQVDTMDLDRPVETQGNVRYKWVQDINKQTRQPVSAPRREPWNNEPMALPQGTFNTMPPEDKDTWYESYLLNGTLPPMAYRDVASRDAFTKGFPDYLRRKGITPTEGATRKLEMKALTGSLNNQEKIYGMMGSFVNNLNAQVDKVKQIHKDIIQRVGTRALDMPMREWAIQFKGSGNEAVLSSYLMEISNEIGKLSTGSQASISELSISAQERWNKIHDPNLSAGELMKVLEATKDQANLRRTAAQKELGTTKTRMKGLGNFNPETPGEQPPAPLGGNNDPMGIR